MPRFIYCFPDICLHQDTYSDCSFMVSLTEGDCKQGSLLLVTIKSSLRKFYGHHHDLVNRISVSQMTTDMFHLSYCLNLLRLLIIHWHLQHAFSQYRYQVICALFPLYHNLCFSISISSDMCPIPVIP